MQPRAGQTAGNTILMGTAEETESLAGPDLITKGLTCSRPPLSLLPIPQGVICPGRRQTHGCLGPATKFL